MKPPPVGTLAWERAGGPALSLGERCATLAGAGRVVIAHTSARWGWTLRRWLGFAAAPPPKIDLERWSPPDSAAAKQAEAHLRAVANRGMIDHCFRTYYFSAIAFEHAGEKPALDKETLYVAALMHDVGLFDAQRAAGCFTVASAKAARRIATESGWDEARQDRMALAITSNLNSSVPAEAFGAEAHFMSSGGLLEVLAQQWRIHPDNLSQILKRHPRHNFAADGLPVVKAEARRNKGGRFACLDPLFPILVGRSHFRI